VRRAFTLVELLVVLAVIAILAMTATTFTRSAIDRARSTQCLANLRSLGTAILLHATDNDGRFPRSSHTGHFWPSAIADKLGAPPDLGPATWPAFFEAHFRCPADPRNSTFDHSYGLNVHFELDPDSDDYTGSPATWHRLASIPQPSSTILLAEVSPSANGDHFMCHQWSSSSAASNTIAHQRHSPHPHFLFVDGHAAALPITDTFDPSRSINNWNPSLARPLPAD
jgi:prepilin-type N-terminal cleavage/methylation domain-containing protein/prepilin-type processing-associated H-X9-DG protein